MRNYAEKVKEYISKLKPDELLVLHRYFEKFIIKPEELKGVCCLKYCTRESGRHCTNCPEHPMLDYRVRVNESLYNQAISIISKKDYVGFIDFLYQNNLPFPVIAEIEFVLANS